MWCEKEWQWIEEKDNNICRDQDLKMWNEWVHEV